jgi:hypothetical protein
MTAYHSITVPCHTKHSMTQSPSLPSTVAIQSYANGISKMHSEEFPSASTITGCWYSSGMEYCTSICVSPLGYALPLSSSTSLLKDYTGSSSTYLNNLWFTTSTIFYSQGATPRHCLTKFAPFWDWKKRQAKQWTAYVVDFTGIELDTDKMEARLPRDKHDHASLAVQRLLQRGSSSYNDVQSTLGFLSFCTRVIPLARPFLRNLFNFLQSLYHIHPHSLRRLLPKATTDLRWWTTFLRNWSGKRLIRQNRRIIHVYTDASGTKGIGGWWGRHAFSSRMPRRHRGKHINWKEAYAILFALAKWGSNWEGCQITFMCDNSTVVGAVNKKSVHGNAINPLQLVFLAAALYDIEICCYWLASKDNWIADALSRFTLHKLANFQLDKLFNLPSREPATPMSTLRQKLLNFYGTDSPHLQDQHTTRRGTTTKSLQSSTATNLSPSHSKRSRTGSQTLSRRTRRKLSNYISQDSAATMSTEEYPQLYLKTHASNVSSSAHNEYLA